MDYTLSNSYDTDPGTGNRMHEDSKSVPTAVSDLDMNSLMWSLMEIVKAASLTPQQFDKATPATYRVLLQALRSAGVFTTAGLFDNSTKVATTAFVNGNGVRFQPPTAYATNTNLPNSQAGGLAIGYGASGIALTLPPLSSVSSGAVYTIVNQNSLTLTLYATSGEFLQYGAGVTTGSLLVQSGESITVVSTGTNWLFVGGSSNLATTASFVSNLSASGYQRLPTGWVHQWGTTGVVAAGSDATFSLPTTFATPFACTLTYVDTGGSPNPAVGNPVMFRGFPTNGQIKVRNGGSSGAQYMFDAIGK